MDVSNFSPNAQSSAVSATRDLPSSSGQLPAQNPSLQQEEVFYLILKYLNSFDALKDSAISLETNLKSIGAFGSITGWDGSHRPATVADYEKKYPMIPHSQLLLLLQNGEATRSTSASNSTENVDKKPSLLRKVVGFYNPNISEQRDQFTSLSKELSHVLGRLRQNLEAISTAEDSRARILKRIESGFEDEFTLDTVDLTTNSPQNQVVTDLKEIGGKKDVSRLERLIHDSKLEVNRIKEHLIKLIERLRTGGFLANNFEKGSIDSGIEWNLCRSLGLMNIRSSNATGMGRSFLSSTQRFNNQFFSNYKLHYTISGHMLNPAYCCVFDQTGNYLLTGADDYLVKIWDVNKGQLVRTCRGHMTYISLIAVSPDNSIFASACVGGSIRVWRMSDGICLQVLQHQATVNWLKFDPSSCTLASCGDDGLCIVWDLSKLLAPDKTAIPLMDKILIRKAKYLSRFNPNIVSVVPTNKSSQITSSSTEDNDEEGKEEEEEVIVYRPFVGMFDWSREEEVLALPSASSSSSSSSGSPPSQVSPNLALPHLRDINAMNSQGDPLKVLCLDVSNLGNILVTGCEDGVARIWKFGNLEVNELSDAKYPTRTQKRPMELQLPKLKGMLSHEDFTRVEKVAKHLLLRLEGHVSPITDIQFNSLGDRIVTGSSKDGSVRIWSLSRDYTESIHIVLDLGEEDESVANIVQSRMRGRLVRSGSRIQVHNVCWTCDDLRVITIQSVPSKNGNSNEDNLPSRLKVWDSMNGDLLRIIRNVSDTAGKCLTRHPFNPFIIVTGGQDGYLNVWNIDTESNLSKHYIAGEESKPANIVDISVSADGTRIAATDQLGRLTVVGLDDPNKYNKVLKEQYFSSDYSDIMLDENGFAVDVGTQLPADRAPIGQLIRIDGSAYERQPKPISGPSPLSESAVDGLLQQLDTSRGKLDSEIDRVFSVFSRHKRLGRVPKKYSDFRSEDKSGFHSTPVRSNATSSLSRVRYIEYDEMSSSSDSEIDSVTGERRNYNYRNRQNGTGQNHHQSQNQRSRSARSTENRRGGIMTFTELSRRDSVRRSNRSRSQISTYNDELDEEDFMVQNGSSSRAARAAARAARYGPSRSRNDDSSASGVSSEMDEDESVVLDSDSDTNMRSTRKSSRGRKARSNYSSEVEQHEPMETANAVKAIAKTKTQVKKQRTVPEGSHEIGLEMDREWLQRDVPNEYLYSPQLGDVVIYFPQGHREHLKNISETSSPPWLAFTQKWPLVECQVRDISFEFPTPQDFRKCKSAIAVVTLVILRVPTKHILQPSGQCFVELGEPRATRHNSMKEYSFEVKMRNTGLADFIIPNKLFQKSICLPWYEGIRISVKFSEFDQAQEQEVLNDYYGRVIRLSNSDEEWPHSPWEVLEVVWDDANAASSSSSSAVTNLAPEIQRISPWDAVPIFDSDSHYNSILQKYKLPSIPEEDALRMDREIEELMNREYEKFNPFEFEVDSSIFPNYYSAIEVPIYIDLIRRRLQKGYYRQVEALEWDINKMYKNCEYYNQAGSEIVQTAAELRDSLLSIIGKALPIRASSSSSSSSAVPVQELEDHAPQHRKRLRSVAHDSLLSLDSPKRTVSTTEEMDTEEHLSIRLKRRRPALKMSSDEEEEVERKPSKAPEPVQKRSTQKTDSLSFVLPPRNSRSTAARGKRQNDSDSNNEEDDKEDEENENNSDESEKSSEDSEAPRRGQRVTRNTRGEKPITLRVPPKSRREDRRSSRKPSKKNYAEEESEQEEDEMEDESEEEEDDASEVKMSRRPSRGRNATSNGRSRGRPSTRKKRQEQEDNDEEEEDDDSNLFRGRRRTAARRSVNYKDLEEEEVEVEEEEGEEEEEEEESTRGNRGSRGRRSSSDRTPAAPPVAAPTSSASKRRITAVSSSSLSVPQPVPNAYHRIDPEVRRQMLQVVDFASDLDHKYTYFADPVDPEVAPQYYDIIQQPMDLSLIRSNIQSRRYQSVEEVIRDVLLIYDNCEHYNLEDSNLVKEAKRQRRMFLTFAKNTFEFKA